MSEVTVHTTQDSSHDPINENEGEEAWDEGDEDYEDDGEIDEGDAAAEAEEIARRLRDQLWADISKAQADRAGASSTSTVPVSVQALPDTSAPAPASRSQTTSHNVNKREEAALATMKTILAYAEKDPLVRSTLASAIVPDSQGSSALDVLSSTFAAGSISKAIARPLSHLLVSLARSDALFADLRHSTAPSMQLDKGKRKRNETDDYPAQNHYGGAPPSPKRLLLQHYDLYAQIAEAVRVITHALAVNSSAGPALNSTLVSSIQLQLHQVFLLAVTSSTGGGPEMSALQEISGLIQALGVLSGIQIGPSPGVPSPLSPHVLPPGAPTPWPAAASDIGTAVYPCLSPACRKTFNRLYSLRAHQRVHAVHRPFRCTVCPASFARNHDLKRHTKAHDKKAWKCFGCGKIFSRRDAIKRHKNSAGARGGHGAVCVTAEVCEVDLRAEDGDDAREERRSKMWSGLAAGHAIGGGFHPSTGAWNEDGSLEEGEVRPSVLAATQSAILSLHGLLQAHVSGALGTNSAQEMPNADPSSGQATLASVIARAQLQSQPFQPPPKQGHVTPEKTLSVSQNNANNPPTDPPSKEIPTVPELGATAEPPPAPSLAIYGLSEEQTKMLELAIANAASAAQAQAEAEAALEEEEDGFDEEEGEDDELDEGGSGAGAVS